MSKLKRIVCSILECCSSAMQRANISKPALLLQYADQPSYGFRLVPELMNINPASTFLSDRSCRNTLLNEATRRGSIVNTAAANNEADGVFLANEMIKLLKGHLQRN